jgi:hypothetical protein
MLTSYIASLRKTQTELTAAMSLDMTKVLNETKSIETVLDTRVVPHHSKAVKLLGLRVEVGSGVC